ncbi:MAG: tripartite tricarboxylate transporter TctB family protein [Paracoccaceae bacterium]
MLSQRLANTVFAALVIIACIYFAWVAQGFETGGLLASSGLPSKFFPQLMLGLAGLAAAVVFCLYAAKSGASGDKGEMVFANAGEALRGILMLVVCVVCYFIWRNYGFVAMAVLLGPLSLIAMGIRKPVIYAVVLGLTGFVYVVFTYGLGVRLV